MTYHQMETEIRIIERRMEKQRSDLNGLLKQKNTSMIADAMIPAIQVQIDIDKERALLLRQCMEKYFNHSGVRRKGDPAPIGEKDL